MNEAEWNRCTDPQKMLGWLRHSGKASDRKLRLFACACCRIWHLLVHEVSREAVEVGERFADGLATEDEQSRAYQEADDVWALLPHAFDEDLLQDNPSFADAITAAGIPRYAAEEAAEAPVAAVESSTDDLAAYLPAAKAVGWMTATSDEPDARAETDERSAQAALVRDLFGPLPFRDVPIDPTWLSWNDSTVKKLAQSAYDHRSLPDGTLDPGRRAVLADALEEAGCANEEILGHLRGPGPHVRGCWPIDLLLGKS
jgi:hypothetical protein